MSLPTGIHQASKCPFQFSVLDRAVPEEAQPLMALGRRFPFDAPCELHRTMEYLSEPENLDENGYTQLDFSSRNIARRPVFSEKAVSSKNEWAFRNPVNVRPIAINVELKSGVHGYQGTILKLQFQNLKYAKGTYRASPHWRCIAVTLGILCLVMLVIAVVLGTTGILMQAKYSSTRNMLDSDGDTTMSLHSRASTTTQQPEPGHTEHQLPSSAWRPVALTLLTLCLVLLIGLAALGLVFFQYYQLSNSQQDSISEKEERLGNLSRKLQSLQTQNKKLVETLQRVAEKLCRELYNKTGEHRCSPCPEKWKWLGDKCYQFYKESKNWQGCEYFCIAENSTMLKINTQEVLEFAMSQSYSEFFYSYWTGLSRSGSGKGWLWIDGAPYTSELFEIIIDFTSLRSRDCVTILNGKAFSKDCKELRRCACEKMATTVKLEKLP
ncbi:C-type lectin domain family 1 member A [Pteropus alecto]|uniref:C-type lectin domain family 1 member A n=2 Tax=Pteropus alecto TaxID=9402 RepID=L5L1C9_PTEAL|nr:C-type lectin domain family 1 member A [Pteropus alecto]